MPNFGVGDTPVQISQTGTQEALIQNTGNTPVYLDAYSSVSQANHGLSLAPLSSVNWAAGRDLWAVAGVGQNTSLTVLYGATGTALSEVSAVVTGDVTATITGPVDANITNAVIPVAGSVNANVTNASIGVTGNVTATIDNASIPVTGTVNANITNANIDATVNGNVVVDSGLIQVGGINTPVQVQGGGVVLHTQSGSITALNGISINVPAPASGLTYFGIGIIVTATTKTVANDVPLTVEAFNLGLGVGIATRHAALLPNLSAAGYLGTIGRTATASMVVPVATSFPVRVDLTNNGATGTIGYSFTAVGLSYADTFPRDLSQWNNGIEVVESFTTAAANSYVVVAASMETRQYLLTSLTGTTGTFVVEAVDSSGTWSITQHRAHNSVYGAQASGANISAEVNSVITIPGDGFPHRIRTSTAVTGSVALSYLGKIA